MQDRFEELKNNLLPRFWDTSSNDMLYPNEISTEEGDFRYLLPFMGQKNEIFYTLSEMLINPRFIPMKPTGLKDKKGNLIYENDFVRMCGLTDVYIIKWVQESCEFIAQYTKNSNIIKHWYDIKGFEIIGNIHSNPELVEVQK